MELRRNTLSNWIIRSSRWFAPLLELMRSELLTEDIIHADETEVRVLNRDGAPTKSVSRMWVYCSGRYSAKPMSLYQYNATRSGKVVKEMLSGYSGYLQTDGYTGYNAVTEAKRVGCWAHARRKFVDCLPKGVDSADSKSAQVLALVEQLFANEKGFEDMPEKTPAKIKKKREELSAPVLTKYWELLSGISAVGESSLEKATNYSLTYRKELEKYMLDGRLEMTNNRAERAVKPFVIGRKNWLFSDTDKGADASAMVYSIIESAKLNNLDVYGYLMFLLTELPRLGMQPCESELRKYLPWEKLPRYCYTK